MSSEFILMVYKFLPVLFLIPLGFTLGKIGFLNDKSVEVLKKVVLNIGVTALLFTAFTSVSFQVHYLGIFIFGLLICILFFLVGKGLKEILNIDSPYFPFLMTGFEAGMLGIPIYSAIFGEELFHFAIVDFGHEIFIWLIFVPLIIRVGNKKVEENPFVTFIKTPPVIGILIGLLLGTLGVFEGVTPTDFPSVILNTLEYLSGMVIPLITLIVGYQIKFSGEGLKKAVSTVALRVLILSSIAFLLSEHIMQGLLGMGSGFKLAFMMFIVLPPPFIIPIFMETDNKTETQYVCNTLSIHALATLALYMVILFQTAV